MIKPKRVNQHAIARATGVSRATVSLVLRGASGAAESTKSKVLAAAAKMGYRPNALVHSIRSGKSRTIGVMVPPHDTFWQKVCYGIHDRLTEADHLPLFIWDTEEHTEPKEPYALRQIHRLLDRWVDGVIFWPAFAELYGEHLNEFERRNIPVVSIDHHVPGLKSDVIGNDEEQIARFAVSHLTELGHRSFLVLSGPEGIGWSDGRNNAMVAEFARNKKLRASYLRLPFSTDLTPLVREGLEANPSVTAVIGGTDLYAKAGYQAAVLLGRSIPDDLSVVGVGDLGFADVMSPPLTTIRQDGYAVGRRAAQVALERGAGLLSGPFRHFSMPVHFLLRNSTAPAVQGVTVGT
jgi:LacI family transcriptional regulator